MAGCSRGTRSCVNLARYIREDKGQNTSMRGTMHVTAVRARACACSLEGNTSALVLWCCRFGASHLRPTGIVTCTSNHILQAFCRFMCHWHLSWIFVSFGFPSMVLAGRDWIYYASRSKVARKMVGSKKTIHVVDVAHDALVLNYISCKRQISAVHQNLTIEFSADYYDFNNNRASKPATSSGPFLAFNSVIIINYAI